VSEVGRRLVHASGAVLPGAFLAGLLSWEAVRWLLVVGAVCTVVLEALRLSGYVSWWIFDALTRDYEQDNPAGYALYELSWTATAWLFAPSPRRARDADARARRPRQWPALPRGTRRQAGVGAARDVRHLSGHRQPARRPARGGVAGALVATFADGATPVVRGYVIDDNATIPLGAGAAMWVVLAVL